MRAGLRKNPQHSFGKKFNLSVMMKLIEFIFFKLLKREQVIGKSIGIKINFNPVPQQLIKLCAKNCAVRIIIFKVSFSSLRLVLLVVVGKCQQKVLFNTIPHHP